jgi:hypothetical protein
MRAAPLDKLPRLPSALRSAAVLLACACHCAAADGQQLSGSVTGTCAVAGAASDATTFPCVSGEFGTSVSLATGLAGAPFKLAEPIDGCALEDGFDATGHVLVMARGACSFATKAERAVLASAIAMVLINSEGPPFPMGEWRKKTVVTFIFWHLQAWVRARTPA